MQPAGWGQQRERGHPQDAGVLVCGPSRAALWAAPAGGDGQEPGEAGGGLVRSSHRRPHHSVSRGDIEYARKLSLSSLTAYSSCDSQQDVLYLLSLL